MRAHKRDTCCMCPCVNLLPLLLLQVVVAALLALQVKFGVLQFSSQSLGFLLQLLDVSLGLLIIGLQVADLRDHETRSFIEFTGKRFLFLNT